MSSLAPSTQPTRTLPNASTSLPPAKRHCGRPAVADTLSYLDHIKVAYSTRPAVYNSFLDIMKQFKTHALDTEGVIAAIQRLFADRPALLADFELFLPSGFSVYDGQKPPVSRRAPVLPSPPPAPSASRALLQEEAGAVEEDSDDDDVMITGVHEAASPAARWLCSTCSFMNDRSFSPSRCEMCQAVERSLTSMSAAPPGAPAPSSASSSSSPSSSASTSSASTTAAAPATTSASLSSPATSAAAAASSSSSAFPSVPSPSSTSSSSSSLDALAQSSADATERKSDVKNEVEPPPSYRPVVAGMKEAEAAIKELLLQLSLSHSLAFSAPVLPADTHCNLTFDRRQLCTELAEELALTAHLRLACHSATTAIDAASQQLAALMEQQRARNAVLLSTFTQLAHEGSSSTPQSTDRAEAPTGAEKEKQLAEEEEEAAEDEKTAVEADEKCPICLDAVCDALLQPCCQISCCVECARELKRKKKSCPRCDQKIRSIIAVKR